MAPLSKKATRLDRKKIFKGYCFEAFLDQVRWPNGQELKRSLIAHPGISVIVPLLGRGKILLIRQYRYGADQWLWEVPAGTMRSNETPLACAKREIEEETGYRAKKWKFLAQSFTSPGYSTEKIYCYAARGLSKGQMALEHDELLTVSVFSRQEVWTMMIKKQIRDAKSLIALFYVLGAKARC